MNTLGPFLGDAVARGGGARPGASVAEALRRRARDIEEAEQRDPHAPRRWRRAARPRVRRGRRAVAPARAQRSRSEPGFQTGPGPGLDPSGPYTRADPRVGSSENTETHLPAAAVRRTAERQEMQPRPEPGAPAGVGGAGGAKRKRRGTRTEPLLKHRRPSLEAAPPVPRPRRRRRRAATRSGPRRLRTTKRSWRLKRSLFYKKRQPRRRPRLRRSALRLRRRGGGRERLWSVSGSRSRRSASRPPLRNGGAVLADDERGETAQDEKPETRRPPAHDRAVHDRDSARGREQRVHRARRFRVPQSLRPVSRRDVRRDLRRGGALLVRKREGRAVFPRPVPRRHGRARARGPRRGERDVLQARARQAAEWLLDEEELSKFGVTATQLAQIFEGPPSVSPTGYPRGTPLAIPTDAELDSGARFPGRAAARRRRRRRRRR